ncbi:hypothetical protein [Sunxiuqinia dokdonensis]|uniref:DUF4149 domain-containing protein n=1 Tax=Sunxiuqinia dokdonensis TaxID=1409788 RepID=A0A0L8VCF7_9BACT|nr:hypothetical protein [Sunxiuqinia dokdonensis]KOH46140.1 hypothetical protein NC99_10520 [Sunxiuqinia dokdonensis]
MKKKLVASFILVFWAGFVSAISFLEAWLKFKAPGITLPLGLGIGKLVFTAMNRTEWVLLALFIFAVVYTRRRLQIIGKTSAILFFILLILLSLQTFWFLPELNQRADLIIAGQPPEDSLAHLFYGLAEVIKVVSLIALAFATQQTQTINNRNLNV